MRLRAVLEIGLGGDRVLLIAQLVADVGDQLGQHDADVGLARALPRRQQLVQAVEQDRAERAVVLGEVVDRRRRGQVGRAVGGGGAQSKSGPHSTLNENVDLGELRIEAGERLGDVERILRRPAPRR